MEKRRLGNSDMYITRIGVGACAIGGAGGACSWGPHDERGSIAAIQEALDRGINWIGTTAIYGLDHSEQVVAQSLRGRSPRPYVFTKCQGLWNGRGKISGSVQAASIRRECEASLRRLKLDVIDLYQIHWPEPDGDIEEGWTEMARLKEEGKVRYIGVSTLSIAQMERAQRIAPITALQTHYSLIVREIEESVLPFARKSGIGVVVYSTIYSGLLRGAMTREAVANFAADDWRRSDPHLNEPLLSLNVGMAGLLREIGARHGQTEGEVALAWVLAHPAVTAAIVGVQSAEQVQAVIGAGEFRLTNSEINELDDVLESRAA